jgi:hypothetical protein
MQVVRTPLAGIGLAFALLLVETLGGRALVTRAQALESMQERQVIDGLPLPGHARRTCNYR